VVPVLVVVLAAIGLVVENLLYTFAVQRIPIGDCITLFSLAIVWTPILESTLRCRCLGKGHVTSGSLGLVGIILITRPSIIFPQHLLTEAMPLGYFCAVLAGVCNSLISNTVGFHPNIHWSVWFLAYGCIGVLWTPVAYIVIHHGAPPSLSLSPPQATSLVLIAILDIVGQIFRINAIQTGTPTTNALAGVAEGHSQDRADL
jgi:drug/metabolite transporter (DMT)-like permease